MWRGRLGARGIGLLGCIGLSLGAAPGCSRLHGPPAEQGSADGTAGGAGRSGYLQGEQSALAALVTEQLDAELQFSPTRATWLGDHGLDDRLDDVRPEAFMRESGRLAVVLERVRRLREAIDAKAAAAPGPGSPREAHDGGSHDAELHQLTALRVEASLLQSRIESKLQELVEQRPNERNPLYHVNLIAFGLDGLLGPNLATPQGMRALRGRLSAIPALCKEAQRALKNPPEIWTRRAFEVGQMTRDFVAVILPRLLSFVVPALPEQRLGEEVAQRRAEAQRALEEFVAWIGRDLQPRSKGEWALSRERLLVRLRALELLDVPLETVQAVSESDLREARRRFDELARRIVTGAGPGAAASQSPSRTASDALKIIEEEHPRPEELMRAAEAAIDKAYELTTAQGLISVPDDPQPGWRHRPAVTEMPAYRFGYVQLSSAAPLEPEREAQLWIDPVDPSWTDKKRIADHLRMLSRAQLWLSVIHEVVPGHFTQQLVLRQNAATLSPLRQRTLSVALLEGWSGYAEQLLALENPTAQAVGERVQLLALRAQIIRLGRLIAVLRLHAQPGAPPISGGAAAPTQSQPPAAQARLEDAVRFLMEECYLDEYAARREAERATYDPLAGLPALGRLQLNQLRADYLAEHAGEGTEAQRLRAFHDALLSQGALPVVSLRTLLLQKPGPSLLPPPPEPLAPPGVDADEE